MNKTNRMNFYCAWYCPFAQRAWISLFENDAQFTYFETDPYDKNDKWMKLSNGIGTVPLLVTDEMTFTDSWKILKYLGSGRNQHHKEKDLDNWKEHIDNKIIPYFYRVLKSEDGTLQQESKKKLVDGITSFAQELTLSEGSYFSGNDVGIIDILFVPFAYRINILLQKYRSFSLPVEGNEWSCYHNWYDSMVKRESFRKSLKGVDNYEIRLIELYEKYAKGGGQSNLTNINSLEE